MSDAIKALVVDDDAKDLGLHVDLLRADGYQVSAASNGEAALELIAKERFDLIITDIVMRGVSGFEVLQAAGKIKGFTMPENDKKYSGKQAKNIPGGKRSKTKEWIGKNLWAWARANNLELKTEYVFLLHFSKVGE